VTVVAGVLLDGEGRLGTATFVDLGHDGDSTLDGRVPPFLAAYAGVAVTSYPAGPQSAGILMFRRLEDGIEVLVAHPGGPLWANRHEGAWSIPKGVVEPDEDLAAAARREFFEETGSPVEGDLIELGWIRQRSGKIVHAFAVEGDLDPVGIVSNTFPLEWPPRSGRHVDTPEIDRVEWCGPDVARHLLNPSQVPLVDRLLTVLAPTGGDPR
jgi:predicted NUDIX family NTP pyrophosphohydrolase